MLDVVGGGRRAVAAWWAAYISALWQAGSSAWWRVGSGGRRRSTGGGRSKRSDDGARAVCGREHEKEKKREPHSFLNQLRTPVRGRPTFLID